MLLFLGIPTVVVLRLSKRLHKEQNRIQLCRNPLWPRRNQVNGMTSINLHYRICTCGKHLNSRIAEMKNTEKRHLGCSKLSPPAAIVDRNMKESARYRMRVLFPSFFWFVLQLRSELEQLKLEQTRPIADQRLLTDTSISRKLKENLVDDGR